MIPPTSDKACQTKQSNKKKKNVYAVMKSEHATSFTYPIVFPKIKLSSVFLFFYTHLCCQSWEI